MQWTSLSARNSSRPTSALLTYGGPVNVSTVSDPARRHQVLSVNVRGETLSTHFSNMTCLRVRGAVAILIDAVSASFIAGSISDPTGAYISGRPALVNVTALRDPKINRILHATATGMDAGTMSGAHALLTCTLPCLFTYWPHLDELRSGQAVVPMGVVWYPFTTVYVSQVDFNTGHLLDLRLIMAVPSEKIIGEFIAGVQSSLYYPAATIVWVTVVVVIIVSVLFRELTEVERRIRKLAFHLLPEPPLSQRCCSCDGGDECCPHTSSSSPSVVGVKGATNEQQKSDDQRVFCELDRMIVAIQALSRELFTLRAFTTGMMPRPSATIEGQQWRSDNSDTAVLSYSCDAEISRRSFAAAYRCVPYDISVNTTWRVPVTTIYAQVGAEFVGALRHAPYVVHERLRRVLGIFQKHVRRTPGASLDACNGDTFVIHFNASGRTPRHALAALNLCMKCVVDARTLANQYHLHDDVMNINSLGSSNISSSGREIPLACGIASAVAMCGLMGPPSMKSFTVVSFCESQAMFLCRIAKKDGQPILLTWRSVDFALQQMQKVCKPTTSGTPLAASLSPVDPFNDDDRSQEDIHSFYFIPFAHAYLPGEWNRVTDVFVPILNRAGLYGEAR
ncbi:transmembrane protein, putative [Bodo saltans]|uniref:Transmembrane protein, putative n=1 Tax=Bodo saltans TaxID=75058 RepID=A0A0S4J6W9_BODSA|nr:transmembrane protein, putative [Bodo saltans]|eukprot:CUG85339.1 transmembrane protein, putative [Bodo saltans]